MNYVKCYTPVLNIVIKSLKPLALKQNQLINKKKHDYIFILFVGHKLQT